MPKAISTGDLTAFQCILIGTWKNPPNLIDPKTKLPLSYNVMPLPQITAPASRTAHFGGFILKNFAFDETIRFNGSVVKKGDDDPPQHIDPDAIAVVASAPNRGGSYTQTCHAVFYDQQVHFAEGPDKGSIVHVENGAWIHFGSDKQPSGPYARPGVPPVKIKQLLKEPPYVSIAKQISVPHGNSILALGNVDLYDRDKFDFSLDGLGANTIIPGAPSIPDAFVPYPVLIEPATKCYPYPERPYVAAAPFVDPYAKLLKTPTPYYENPNPPNTLNPNYPLQVALEIIKPKRYIHWRVTTQAQLGGSGHVTNVPFEERKSRVTAYWADYWLLSEHTRGMDFDYLAYTQTILMEMDVSVDKGGEFNRYVFPHLTSNVVKKVRGTPRKARQQTETPIE